MGTCRICGKNFGLMGGGSEPYTGQNLQVCNSCGEVLKKIDRTKNEDTQEVKDLFVSVISMTDDADVKRILTEYSKSVISDSEKLVAITNESKEKAERAQNIEENFYDLEKAFKVTTGYDFEGYQIIDYRIRIPSPLFTSVLFNDCIGSIHDIIDIIIIGIVDHHRFNPCSYSQATMIFNISLIINLTIIVFTRYRSRNHFNNYLPFTML